MRQTLIHLWSLLSFFWSWGAEKAGAGWDPFGLVAPEPPPSDAGAGADPFG